MKNRKKRAQREEVRKLLKNMRQELAEHRLAQDKGELRDPVLRVNELIKRSSRAT